MVETALFSMTQTSIDESMIMRSGTAKTAADFTETAALDISGFTRKYTNADITVRRAKTCRRVIPIPPTNTASLIK